MVKEKKSWYESKESKEFVMRSSKEAPRSFLYNLWSPRVTLGKASIGFLSIFLLEQFDEDERRVLIIVDSALHNI